MNVNSSVVASLMTLKNLDIETVARLVHVRAADLEAWLDNSSATDERISFEAQMDILRILGIRDEQPNSDVVHYWSVTEPLFGSAPRVYAAVTSLLQAFGGAKVSYLAREADPAISRATTSLFCLKFARFLAILEVQGHPLRNIRFDPEQLNGLEWNPEVQGIILDEAKYDAMEPGAMAVAELEQYLSSPAELSLWEQLRVMAAARGVLPTQLMAVLGLQDSTGSAAAALPSTEFKANAAAAAPGLSVRPKPAAVVVGMTR